MFILWIKGRKGADIDCQFIEAWAPTTVVDTFIPIFIALFYALCRGVKCAPEEELETQKHLESFPRIEG